MPGFICLAQNCKEQRISIYTKLVCVDPYFQRYTVTNARLCRVAVFLLDALFSIILLHFIV